jgi:hypothetical protein
VGGAGHEQRGGGRAEAMWAVVCGDGGTAVTLDNGLAPVVATPKDRVRLGAVGGIHRGGCRGGGIGGKTGGGSAGRRGGGDVVSAVGTGRVWRGRGCWGRRTMKNHGEEESG